MKIMIRYSILILLYFFIQDSIAQTKGATLPTNKADTTFITSELAENAPQRALIFSAIMPGLGQAYNRKYFKMPFVYGGFIGLGYIITYYNERHTTFKTELFKILADPQYLPPSGITEAQLRTLIDRTRRERDYMMVLTGVFYFLQIADAHIDAHLREFDLNPDLQVKFKPSFEPILNGSFYAGVGIKFRIDQ